MDRSFLRAVLLIVLALLLSSCDFSFARLEFKKAERALKKENFKKAVEHYHKVVIRKPGSPEALVAAREAARISLLDLKSFQGALDFYSYIVRYSDVERERRDAQKMMAQIYFENINNYPAAIEEINKILVLRNDPGEEAELRYKLAKAHFYLNQFFEAKAEIESAIKIVPEESKKFDLLVFLGNILFNTKKTSEAAEIYESLIKSQPERAAKENIIMNVVVCYEELQQFERAIARLEEIRNTYKDQEFVDLKIKRLKERKANMPGARGFRK